MWAWWAAGGQGSFFKRSPVKTDRCCCCDGFVYSLGRTHPANPPKRLLLWPWICAPGETPETAADPVTEKPMKKASWCAGLTMLFVFTTLAAAQTPAATGVPVFQFDKAKSSIGFNVKASVAIAGKFDKWDATLTFTSLRMSRRAFWKSSVRRRASIPEAV